MSEARPAFLFYARDWLASRAALSLAARGVLVDLMAYAWHNDGLPTSEEELRRIVGADRAAWRRAWPELQDRFTLRDGRLYNDWLEAVREESSRYLEGAKTLGQRGGQKSAETRRQRYGSAQPRRQTATDAPPDTTESPEAVRRSGSTEAVRGSASPNAPKPASASASTTDRQQPWSLEAEHSGTPPKANATPAPGTPQAFIAWFCEQHLLHRGRPYLPNYGKDITQLKRMRETLQRAYPDADACFTQMQRMALAMLTSQDDWLNDSKSRGIGFLTSCAQQWIDAADTDDITVVDEAAIAAAIAALPRDHKGNPPPPARKYRNGQITYPHPTDTQTWEYRRQRPDWWNDTLTPTTREDADAPPIDWANV